MKDDKLGNSNAGGRKWLEGDKQASLKRDEPI